MKQLLLSAAAALVALTLSSCLQSETTIHLNKDGSGTLTEETTLGAQMLAMIEQMSALRGGAPQDPVAGMFSEEKAKSRATKLGEGVTFEKAEPVTKNGNQGGRATYHFADINKLRITTSDSIQSISPMGQMAPPIAAGKSNPITFNYAAGKLTVAMPEPEKLDAPAPEALDRPDFGDQRAEMMKQILSDFKLSLKLVIEPGIAETNATYRSDKTITLMEMEMGKLLENPETVKKLQAVDQKNPAAALDAMRSLPGVKFESQKEISIELN